MWVRIYSCAPAKFRYGHRVILHCSLRKRPNLRVVPFLLPCPPRRRSVVPCELGSLSIAQALLALSTSLNSTMPHPCSCRLHLRGRRHVDHSQPQHVVLELAKLRSRQVADEHALGFGGSVVVEVSCGSGGGGGGLGRREEEKGRGGTDFECTGTPRLRDLAELDFETSLNPNSQPHPLVQEEHPTNNKQQQFHPSPPFQQIKILKHPPHRSPLSPSIF